MPLANERFTIAAIPITNEAASDRANSGKLGERPPINCNRVRSRLLKLRPDVALFRRSFSDVGLSGGSLISEFVTICLPQG
jgi:hypothetical protein